MADCLAFSECYAELECTEGRSDSVERLDLEQCGVVDGLRAFAALLDGRGDDCL